MQNGTIPFDPIFVDVAEREWIQNVADYADWLTNPRFNTDIKGVWVDNFTGSVVCEVYRCNILAVHRIRYTGEPNALLEQIGIVAIQPIGVFNSTRPTVLLWWTGGYAADHHNDAGDFETAGVRNGFERCHYQLIGVLPNATATQPIWALPGNMPETALLNVLLDVATALAYECDFHNEMTGRQLRCFPMIRLIPFCRSYDLRGCAFSHHSCIHMHIHVHAHMQPSKPCRATLPRRACTSLRANHQEVSHLAPIPPWSAAVTGSGPAHLVCMCVHSRTHRGP